MAAHDSYVTASPKTRTRKTAKVADMIMEEIMAVSNFSVAYIRKAGRDTSVLITDMKSSFD